MKDSDHRQAGRPRRTAHRAEFSSSSSLARPTGFEPVASAFPGGNAIVRGSSRAIGEWLARHFPRQIRHSPIEQSTLNPSDRTTDGTNARPTHRELCVLPKLLPNSEGQKEKRNETRTPICFDFRTFGENLCQGVTAENEFQDRCLKPLGHPSPGERETFGRFGVVIARTPNAARGTKQSNGCGLHEGWIASPRT